MSWSSAQIQREWSAGAGILDSDLRDASAPEGFDDTITDGEDHPELGIGLVLGHENQVDAAVVVDLGFDLIAEQVDDVVLGRPDADPGAGSQRPRHDVDSLDRALGDQERDALRALSRRHPIAVARRCAVDQVGARRDLGLGNGHTDRDLTETDRRDRVVRAEVQDGGGRRFGFLTVGLAASVVVVVEASTFSSESASVVAAGSFEHSTGMVVVVGAEVVVVVDVVLVVLAATVVVGATVASPRHRWTM